MESYGTAHAYSDSQESGEIQQVHGGTHGARHLQPQCFKISRHIPALQYLERVSQNLLTVVRRPYYVSPRMQAVEAGSSFHYTAAEQLEARSTFV